MAAIHDHWGQNMQKAQNQHIPKLIHIDWNAKQNRIVSCNTMNKSVCFCEKIKSAAENHPILSSMHATLFIVFSCSVFHSVLWKGICFQKVKVAFELQIRVVLVFFVCNRNHPKNGGGHRATFKS
jgi:hypothetical protein